jgi:hypothetical protein
VPIGFAVSLRESVGHLHTFRSEFRIQSCAAKDILAAERRLSVPKKIENQAHLFHLISQRTATFYLRSRLGAPQTSRLLRIMQHKNNLQIADTILKWIDEKGGKK